MQLRLLVEGAVESLEAIMFNAADYMPPPARVRALYHLDIDNWNGRDRLRLLVRHVEAI
jgi:single-stranded-DNA-specific exonuclease